MIQAVAWAMRPPIFVPLVLRIVEGAGAADGVPIKRTRVARPMTSPPRVYTRGGDKGETSLVGGQRVPKDDLRIDAYGTVDELNAIVGLVRAEVDGHHELSDLDDALEVVQHRLFDLGSVLATLPTDISDALPRVTESHTKALEGAIDRASAGLPTLRNFVLPGGSRLNALLHVARTVCRRAERLVVRLHRDGGCGVEEVRYLNRLSDAFFVWARFVADALGRDEVLWKPGK